MTDMTELYASTLDGLQPGAWDAGDELVPLDRRDPGVLLAPAHQGRDGDLAVPLLDLVGVALVGLGDLPVGGRLPLALDGQGHVLPLELLRLAVTGHVPDEHLVVAGECPGDVTPHIGGEGGAVQQHDGFLSGLPEAVPAHGPRRAAIRLAEPPFAYVLRPCRSPADPWMIKPSDRACNTGAPI